MTFDAENSLVAFTDAERLVMARVGGFDEPTARVDTFSYVLDYWLKDVQERITDTVEKNLWNRNRVVGQYRHHLDILGSMGAVLLVHECEEVLRLEAIPTE